MWGKKIRIRSPDAKDDPATRSLRRVRRCGARLAILLLSLSLSSSSAAQSGLGPQGVVRRFCDLDGRGQRLATSTWPAFAALVEWPYEPVWDRAILITGYEVGPPLPLDLNTMVVDVRFSVVGQISPNGQGDEVFLENVSFRVRPDEYGNWRIVGPPPSPHLFASGVDISVARRAMHPGQPRFPTSSDFVWQMFVASSWDIEYETTAELPLGRTFKRIENPEAGDLVVYLRDGAGYHVGILTGKRHLVSATINAGVVRSAVEAFAGDRIYLRLMEPLPTEPEPLPTEPAEPPTAVPTLAALAKPTTKKTATPTRTRRGSSKRPSAVTKGPARKPASTPTPSPRKKK